MKRSSFDVLILGAGLTGLTLAYRLRASGLSIRLLEGRDRLGGRILTLRDPADAPREMGATWFGQKHTALVGLLGKVCGPIGFVASAASGRFPWSMGWTILTNDLIWWLPFGLILWHAARTADDRTETTERV